eukprot:729287-Alexandrium_andersonii.AAC.1
MKPEWDCQAVLYECYWILAVGQTRDRPQLRDLAVSTRTQEQYDAFKEAFEYAWPRHSVDTLPGESGRGRDFVEQNHLQVTIVRLGESIAEQLDEKKDANEE